MIGRATRTSLHQDRVLLAQSHQTFHVPRRLCRCASSRAAGVSVSSLLSTRPASEIQQPVTVSGWVRSVRRQKRVAFAAVTDGSTVKPLQVVLSPDQAKGLSTGASVQIRGEWTTSPNGKEQSHELHASEVTILGAADSANYPLQKKYQSAEYLRTLPHLRARSTFNALLLRLRSYSIAHLTAFFATRGFVQTHPPIVTSSDCEGAGEVFTVSAGSSRAWAPKDSGLDQDAHFFRHPKYLTVSSQLHLEALAHSVGKVWTLSPTFRAERSDTARHLSEFYMLEAEASFVDELEDIMALVESTLQDIATILPHSAIGEELLSVKRATETGEDEDQSVVAETLQSRWSGLARKSWPRVTYTEVVMLLREAVEKNEISFDFPPTWESGLQAEHERYITQTIGSKGPVFVTDYPQHLKAFYMLPSASTHSTSNAPGPTVSCFDLLLPDVCEVAGGSLREHRLPELLHAMHRHGLIRTSDPALLSDDDLGSLKWYVDLRRWGTVPHGGFGLGFDRLLGYLAGVSNVREVVTFPRWVGRCDC